MTPAGSAARFRLASFERYETELSVLVHISGVFSASDPHGIAHTAVLLVRREGHPPTELAPLRGSSVVTTSDEGVEWKAAFAVPKQALDGGAPAGFALSADGLAPVRLPDPTELRRPKPGANEPSTTSTAPEGRPSAPPQHASTPPPRASTPPPRRLPRFSALTAVLGRLALPLLAALAAGAAATAGFAVAPSRYSASAMIVVTPVKNTNPDYADVPVLRSSGGATGAIATARAVLSSFQIAELTADRMGVGWSSTHVESSVKVTAASNASLVTIKATTDSPRSAAKLADTYVAAALAYRGGEVQRAIRVAIGQVQAELGAVGVAQSPTGIATAKELAALESLVGHGDPTLALAGPARVAGPPTFKHDALVVLLAIVCGGLLGLCASWFRGRRGTRAVQAEREITDLLGIPILARLPVRGLVDQPTAPSPTAVNELQGAFTLLELAGMQPRTIALVSACSGDGKTSAAIALAAHRARTGQPVAVLDFDWRKQDAARRLRARQANGSGENGRGWATLFSTAAALPKLVVGVIKVPVEHSIARAMVARGLEMAQLVVIDTPPLEAMHDGLAAAAVADVVLIVVHLGRTSEAALAEARDALLRAGVFPAGVLMLDRNRPTGMRPPAAGAPRPVAV